MRAAFIALYRRELSAYFETPIAYVVMAALVSSAAGLAWHAGGLFEANSADLDALFGPLPWLLAVLIPALAMRAWSEERATGTHELLLAAPVPTGVLVGAKFAAGWSVALVGIVGLTPLWVAVSYLGRPDHATVLTGYLGAWALAGVYLAITQAASALTHNQVISYVAGLFACLCLTALGTPVVLNTVTGGWPPVLQEAVASLSALSRFANWTAGTIGVADVIYFISVAGGALAATAVLINATRGTGR